VRLVGNKYIFTYIYCTEGVQYQTFWIVAILPVKFKRCLCHWNLQFGAWLCAWSF